MTTQDQLQNEKILSLEFGFPYRNLTTLEQESYIAHWVDEEKRTLYARWCKQNTDASPVNEASKKTELFLAQNYTGEIFLWSKPAGKKVLRGMGHES
jgi:hypothetical protein